MAPDAASVFEVPIKCLCNMNSIKQSIMLACRLTPGVQAAIAIIPWGWICQPVRQTSDVHTDSWLANGIQTNGPVAAKDQEQATIHFTQIADAYAVLKII